MNLTRVAGLAYGGDYNPEQWPEEVWRTDAELMAAAGVNLVTVGVFSWARLEPSPGEYDMDWLARVLDVLWARGIAVDLATATASPPAWLARLHPEILPVTADGVRLEFGSRQHYCPSSPVFRRAATALTREVARRFADHPALTLWHVSNEYGDELQECYCEVSATAFRDWLRERYGDIATLNHAWGTDFWSQHYTAFDQIAPPRSAPGPINPTQQLDWRRFSSDTMLECYLAEREVLREESPGVPITTNFMSMFAHLDYWKWAAAEDVVSDDAYPDPADPQAHINAAMNFDLMRSLRHGQSWMLMEQAPSAVSWREVNVPKTPECYRLWSLHAVARGADAVMHFQWRASVAGAEKFHSAMLPHGGTRSPGWERTVRMGADLKALAGVAGAATDAQVAIMLDWNSWWALEIDQRPSALVSWKPLVYAWYKALWHANVTVDFVAPRDDLTGYRAVLAPNLYLMDDATSRDLDSYVASGGTFVSGFFSGIVDANDHVRGAYPAALRDVLGLRIEEFWPLPAEEFVTLDNGARGSLWRDDITLTSATAVAHYADGPLSGKPAITRHRYGDGEAWYLSTLLDDASLSATLIEAVSAAGVEVPRDVPDGVELCRRGRYLFVLNHSGQSVTVALGGDHVDVLSGSETGETLALPPHEVACLVPIME